MQQLQPVTGSSQIAAFAYDGAQRVLSIQFQSSKQVYHYQDVPPDVATGFEAAESKGRYFGNSIKDQYSFVKAPADQAEPEQA